MLITEQYLVRRAAGIGVDEGNLASSLAYQEITGRFRRERVVELNTVWRFRLCAIHQNDILVVDIQRETGADNQHIVAQPTGKFFQRAQHPRFAVGKAQQQMFLTLAEVFFPARKDYAGGLV